jgi:hypothetical protein
MALFHTFKTCTSKLSTFLQLRAQMTTVVVVVMMVMMMMKTEETNKSDWLIK